MKEEVGKGRIDVWMWRVGRGRERLVCRLLWPETNTKERRHKRDYPDEVKGYLSHTPKLIPGLY